MEKLDRDKFPYVSKIELRNVLIAYQSKSDLEDGRKLRVCYLGNGYEYQGASVEELFKKAGPDVNKENVELVTAFVNVSNLQWIFFYKRRKEGGGD